MQLDDLINRIASVESGVEGVKTSYKFAENPDRISDRNVLPLIMHHIPRIDFAPAAKHNRWRDEVDVISAVFVLPRQDRTSALKYMENDILTLLQKYVIEFKNEVNYRHILGSGFQSFTSTIEYGALPELNFKGLDYAGFVVRHKAIRHN